MDKLRKKAGQGVLKIISSFQRRQFSRLRDDAQNIRRPIEICLYFYFFPRCSAKINASMKTNTAKKSRKKNGKHFQEAICFSSNFISDYGFSV